MMLSEIQCYNPKRYNGYTVPCGKCYACKLKRSNDWSIRLKEQYNHYNGKAVFVTLTYDESCLTYHEFDTLPNEPLQRYAVLCKRDIQLFHKRLRHKVGKLDYFLVGEYGPTTLRPHYHAIYFGFDMSVYDTILSAWDKGFITCSLVSAGRIAYVAKYSLIPQSLPVVLTYGPYKPFMVVSKGMGLSHLETEQMVKMYNSDNKLYYNDNGYKKSLPRYYRNKVFSEDKRQQFALDYMKRCHEEREKFLSLQYDNPAEYQKQLKRKRDWVYGHKYDVENRILKKPKI